MSRQWQMKGKTKVKAHLTLRFNKIIAYDINCN